ncbi:hypothetical protein GUJ93_ZPchr0009g2412 [Zizania palustris]|uniref:Uncharacterized protein n=1 Tax=Zizania palustris TaxID=103762 RepID=A0A8J5RKS8_ZIZPA|nr:hypothetical protein GUJ93_ZPchr0009g2412 [Zizania palustris]
MADNCGEEARKEPALERVGAAVATVHKFEAVAFAVEKTSASTSAAMITPMFIDVMPSSADAASWFKKHYPRECDELFLDCDAAADESSEARPYW